MTKIRFIYGLVRVVLFSLILVLGTMVALTASETRGLALADLSNVPITSMAATTNANVLYAGVVDGPQVKGIYRSNDNGNIWQVVSSGPAATVSALAVNPANPATVYAGTVGGPITEVTSLWRSDNGGETWRRFALSLPADPSGQVPAVTALVTDPTRPNVLYVGTDGLGVYQYNAKHNGYQLLGDLALYNASVKSLAVGSPDRIYALTNKGLFVTRSERWQRLEAVPEQPISLAVNNNLVYAGGPSGGLYRSNDGGQTWQTVNTGLGLTPGASLRVSALAADQSDPKHVAVATAYGLGSQLAPAGVYESRDAGDHWNKLADINEVVTNLNFHQGALYATNSQGLVRYGQPPQLAEQPFSAADLRPLANPNVTQAIILALTVVLASLVLVGRIEWLLRLRRQHS